MYGAAVQFLYLNAIGGKDYLFEQDANGDYTLVHWNTAKLGPQPTIAALKTVQASGETAIAANAYKQLRKDEYPPIEDYIDGIVKGDAAQIQAYKDACLAVKAKYPK